MGSIAWQPSALNPKGFVYVRVTGVTRPCAISPLYVEPCPRIERVG
jgi:hypothetical protein